MNYAINATLSGNKDVAKYYLEKTGLYFGEKKYYYLAEVMNDSGLAAAHIGKFLKVRPHSKAGLMKSAFYASQTGDLKGAEEKLNRYLLYYPDDTDALNNKGMLLYYMKNTKEAVATYVRVLSMDPLNMTAHENLRAIYAGSGMSAQLKEEMTRYERAKALR